MPITQAMLLAAGFSTRLRPLTNDIPKPLLPFLHLQLLDFTLAYLKYFGIKSLAVNVHHGKEKFLGELKKITSPKIIPFIEEKILGTGGGIKNMKSFVTEDTFIVVNCDFITDIDLRDAVRFHKEKKALATMVLIPHPHAKKYGEIGISSQGRIIKFPYGKHAGAKAYRKGLFSGIHIFDRSIFDEMPTQNVFCVNREVYAPLIDRRAPVYGYLAKAKWYDVGELKQLALAQFELLDYDDNNWDVSYWSKLLQTSFKRSKNIFVSSAATLHPSVRLKGPVLIAKEAKISARTILGPNVIIGSRAQISQNCQIENAVVFPQAKVLDSSKISKQFYIKESNTVLWDS